MYNQQWYVWAIKLGRFDAVSQFISEYIPEVTQVLYPTVTTERHLKNGVCKKKKTPLYSGYIFLQYQHVPENPKVWLKLRSHPFIHNYVGPCTPADLVSVDSLQKLEKMNVEATKVFAVGDKVRVNGGFFKDYVGKVVAVLDRTIRVEIESPKLLRFVFSHGDLDIIDRAGL